MKITHSRNLLLSALAAISLMASHSYAQGISTKPVDPSSVPDGAVLQMFSETLVAMYEDNPERYLGYVEAFLGLSGKDADDLLVALNQFVESATNYAKSELQRRCADTSFAKTSEGNSVDAILQSLENYRQDLYSQRESAFRGYVGDQLSVRAEEDIFNRIVTEFKSNLAVSTIDERKAVNDGIIDIDEKLDSMCTF